VDIVNRLFHTVEKWYNLIKFMRVKAIKTRLFHPPKDDLFGVIAKAIKKLPERSVVAVASKVVSIHQGRCIPKSEVEDKDKLIKKEADRYLPRNRVPRGYAVLTLKHGILIPSAGIDESNAGDYYVLWPNHIDKIAWQILKFLKKKYKRKKIGVIITDSHTVPMRRGVQGIALAYDGFKPLNDYRGKNDLFGRKFKVSTTNVVDGLAVSAVLAMGEGTEQTPLAIITDIPFVKFSSRPYKPKKKHSSLKINWNEDLYGPLLKAIKWRK
jgi:putative folate metabolism gamma-glutamate ligase